MSSPASEENVANSREAEIQYEEDDEQLPIIEIRELVAIAEWIRQEPHFMKYSEDQLQMMAKELFPEKGYRIAKQLITFLEQEKLRRTQEPRDDPFLVPILEADRLTIKEGEMKGYIDRLEAAKLAPNYFIQEQQRENVGYPLKCIPATDPKDGFRPKTKRFVGLDGDDQLHKQIILRPQDGNICNQKVVKDIYMTPHTTSENYVFEKQYYIPPVFSDKKPTFEEVLQTLPTTDLHGWKQHLARYNYSWDSLTKEQTQLIIQKEPPEEDAEADVEEEAKSENGDGNGLSWKEEFLSLATMIQRIQREVRAMYQRERMEEVFQTYAIQQVPMSPPGVPIPKDLYSIADGIRKNEFTMEEVITYFKYHRREWMLQQMQDSINQYKKMQDAPDSIAEDLQKEWARLQKPYEKDLFKSLLNLYHDMGEVRKGNDTSQHEGIPSGLDDFMVAEADQEYDVDMMELLAEDDGDVESGVEVRREEVQSSFTLIGSQGVKEVTGKILRTLQILQNATGLPIDFELLQNTFVPYIQMSSRMDVLLSLKSSDLSDDMIQRLAVENVNVKEVLSEDYPDRAHIHQTLERHQKDVLALQTRLFGEMMLWWILYIHEACLDGRFKFHYEAAMVSCVKDWALDGYPIGPVQDKGVMKYLLCVYDEYIPALQHVSGVMVVPTIEVDRVIRSMMKSNTELALQMIDKTKKLYEKWQKVSETVIRFDKMFNAAKNKVVTYHNERLPYGHEFANVLKLLPMQSRMEAPKITGRYNVGCCFQKLTPGFQANTDWRGISDTLWTLKNKLSRERITKTSRPHLAFLPMPPIPLPVSGLPESAFAPVHSTELYTPKGTIREALISWKSMGLQLCPPSILELYLEKPLGELKKQRDSHMEWIIKRTGSFQNPMESKDNDTWKLTIGDTRAFLMQLNDIPPQMHNELRKLQQIVRQPADEGLSELLLYICIFAIAFPAMPQKDSFVWSGDEREFKASLETKTDKWNTFVTSRRIPSIEMQQKFITESREKGKKETMDILDTLDPQTRKMLKALQTEGLQVELEPAREYNPDQDQDQDEEDEDFKRKPRYANVDADAEIEREEYGGFVYLAQDPDEDIDDDLL